MLTNVPPSRTYAVNVTFTPLPVVISVDLATAQLIRDLFIPPPPSPSVSDRLSALESKMSDLSNAEDALETSEKALETRVTTEVAALQAQVAAAVAGTATPAELQRLADLKGALDKIAPEALPAPTPAPEPPAAP
jgi:hypothetical protein